jgi:hypothetical protein
MAGDDRQCPPLPDAFPPMPKNETPTSVADAVSGARGGLPKRLKCMSQTQDSQTPDNWVHRVRDHASACRADLDDMLQNPSLIRLTGKHPFNVEYWLSDLVGNVSPRFTASKDIG